jgi:glycosyltransferase involved in cell wall biosynthesis
VAALVRRSAGGDAVKIAFADFIGWDYHAESVDLMPMGGSQSAACHLARALARDGHEVFLLNSTTSPGVYDGVTCLAWGFDVAAIRDWNLDAMVCLLSAGSGALLRQALDPRTLLILWNQSAPDQPCVQALKDQRESSAYDAFAMVSAWQAEAYHRWFGLDRSRMSIMRNAIAPAFTNLFSEQDFILAQKSIPPTLVYTSTPYRGLDLLLDAFGPIRAAIPGARLEVYSSLLVYHASPAEDESTYGALYQRCRAMEGVDYLGSMSQPELARALRRASVLAYPNTYRETSCIVLMEAMAAGCRVVTSHLAALPETAAGFARLIPANQSREAYLPQFIAQTIQALRECTARSPITELELRRQVAHFNQTAVWPVRARQWTQWIATLAQRRRMS